MGKIRCPQFKLIYNYLDYNKISEDGSQLLISRQLGIQKLSLYKYYFYKVMNNITASGLCTIMSFNVNPLRVLTLSNKIFIEV